MSVMSKTWQNLPPEMQIRVIGNLDVVGKIQFSRTSKDGYFLVDECKIPTDIFRIDLKIKNGFVRWVIAQKNCTLLQVDYTEHMNVCFVRAKGSDQSTPIRNASALDQSLGDLCKIIKNPNLKIVQFRLFMTADDGDFSAERARQYFRLLEEKFGGLGHKLRVGKINIDYSNFTVHEPDMLRGLSLLDPKVIYTIVVKGDEPGTIMNMRNAMNLEIWSNSKHLISTPAIRPMEAFWNKVNVSTGYVVENVDFLPRLIEHLRQRPNFERLVITMNYHGEDPGSEGLAVLLLDACPFSNFKIQEEDAFWRNYTMKREGHHLRMEVSDAQVRLFAIRDGED